MNRTVHISNPVVSIEAGIVSAFNVVSRHKYSRRCSVLLLHGSDYDKSAWLDSGIAESLSRWRVSVWGVDLPGHGDTPSMDISPGEFLDQVVDAIPEVKENMVVIAPDLSGIHALEMLATPGAHRFGALVPIGSKGVPEFDGVEAADAPSTLVMWSMDDPVVPFSDACQLVEKIPGAELRAVRGSAHSFFMDSEEASREFVIQMSRFFYKCGLA